MAENEGSFVESVLAISMFVVLFIGRVQNYSFLCKSKSYSRKMRKACIFRPTYTLLKSDVTHRDHVSVVMDPMNVGSRLVNFIGDGTVFALL